MEEKIQRLSRTFKDVWEPCGVDAISVIQGTASEHQRKSLPSPPLSE